MDSAVPATLLAQVEIRDRSDANCVQENGAFCLNWALDNYDRYVEPALEHVVLVVGSVALGFLIAMGLAVLSHRRRWLIPAFTGLTGVIYTIPSISLFLLLLPFTGRGNDTAVIALTAYTLQIIYRNIVTGLANVPPEAKDAGRGMGMTDSQLLRRVELPLATPEIVAGLRIATVSTVAIATLAVFAGGDGLGAEMYRSLDFKTGLLITTGLTITMAIAFDLCLALLQRMLSRWQAPSPRAGRARHAALARRPADA